MKLSIITCFFNSSHRLDAYFKGFRQLRSSSFELEYVLVDNASTDDTHRKLVEYAAALGPNAKVIQECKPGLMHARCAGVAQVQGDYSLFFDDDNEPRPDFLEKLSALILRYPAAVLFAGNSSLPAEYEVPPHLEGALHLIIIRNLSGERYFQLKTYSSPYIPWGAAMVCETRRLKETCQTWQGGDQKVVGRTGSKLSGGEDMWMVHFMTRHDEHVVFSDTLQITHRVDKHRISTEYLSRLAFENGVEYLGHLSAVKAFKPQLLETVPPASHIWGQALLRLPILLVRFLLNPTGAHLANAASRLGFVFNLLLAKNNPQRAVSPGQGSGRIA